MEKNVRVAWLDYVRFFSIFLVIVFHTPPRFPLMDDAVILNLRVPVFFCISGFLYRKEKYSSFFRYFLHRGKQILVPYTTFFIIFYALWLFVGRSIVGAEEQSISVWRPVVEFLEGCPNVVVAPFWYIACLFSIQMLYYAVESIVGKRMTLTFAVCVALSLVTWFLPYVKFWNLSNALLYLPFYAFGNCFKDYLTNVSFASAKKTSWLCAVGVLSMLLMMLVNDYHNTCYYNAVKVFAGLMVIPAYVCVGKFVSKKLGSRKVVEFVVVSGTVYLGMQNYFIGFIKILLNKVFYDGVIDDNAWLRVVIALAVMAGIYPVAWLIDRYAPWLIGKGKIFDKI